MNRPAFTLAAHNRREITLGCLRSLRADGVMTWADIYLVDDGSTDGTSAAIRREFPEVKLLSGDGTLFWTGATERAMRTAYADGAECCVWLNDDTRPLPGACARLVATMRATGAIVTGQCFIPPDGPVVYGGLRQQGFRMALVTASGDQPIAVDATSGNFVAIPRSVMEQIGFPDGHGLPHAFGDIDYALRARTAGIARWVEPRATAHARPNALGNYASWLLSDIRIGDIWRPLFDKRSYAYGPAHARFLTRHFGGRGAIEWVWTVLKRGPVTLLRLTTTTAWRRRRWGARSYAWQEEQRVRAALARSGNPTTSAETGGDQPGVERKP